MLRTIYSYLEHPESCCSDLRAVGGRPSHKDGSKLICEDPSVALSPDSCLVYSFGVANDWSFDRGMVERGCEVHSFDPSITRAEGKTEHGAIFHRQGLSGDVNETLLGDWRVMTVGTTMKGLGHTGRTLDYLKIDAEGAEMDWLNGEDVEVLQRVRQLAMEVHFFDLQIAVPAKAIAFAVDSYYAGFQVLNDLGFCLVSVRENPINSGRRFMFDLGAEKATLFEVLWVKR